MKISHISLHISKVISHLQHAEYLNKSQKSEPFFVIGFLEAFSWPFSLGHFIMRRLWVIEMYIYEINFIFDDFLLKFSVYKICWQKENHDINYPWITNDISISIIKFWFGQQWL